MARILTVIPARAGSRRLSRKNHAKLGGVSLVNLALDAAEFAGLTNYPNVVRVSSNDDELAGLGHYFLRRPEEISGDRSDIRDATKHALEAMELAYGWQFDLVVTLQPTLPVRPSGLIASMLERKEESGARSALSVVPAVPWMWRLRGGSHAWNEWSPGEYVRSQDFDGAWLQEFNAVQISDRDVVLAGKRWELPLLLCEMPRWCAIDIDDAQDLEDAQMLWKAVVHRKLGRMRSHLVTNIGRTNHIPLPLARGGSMEGSEDGESQQNEVEAETTA
jgi:N-acylneuraminate cytidylyltransferase